jgi:hypothetical protein
MLIKTMALDIITYPITPLIRSISETYLLVVRTWSIAMLLLVLLLPVVAWLAHRHRWGLAPVLIYLLGGFLLAPLVSIFVAVR